MTEESFQQGRKLMQQANYLRGIITKAKGEVAKWTKIEDSHRLELRQSQADGANKCLQNAMKRLDELRLKFEGMKFPDSNIVVIKKKTVQCEGCGAAMEQGNEYCNQCLDGTGALAD